MKPISRSGGRSAVAAAAYRAGESLENESSGLVHDFTRRSGVEHAEIVLPSSLAAGLQSGEGSSGLSWAYERSTLWNTAERSEKRKDARVAREVEVALPHELSAEQRLELTRAFAQKLADRYGVAVDFAIHSPHGHTDIRNHHAHILMTTRKVGVGVGIGVGGGVSVGASVGIGVGVGFEGLGEKSELELENKKLAALGLPSSHEQLRDIRMGWEELTNEHLARAGLELRIDHRSHVERGLEIEPTQHVGVHATQMERQGKPVSRVRLDEKAAQRNAALICEKPEQVLILLTNEKSVFDQRDIARVLHRYIGEADAFQVALAKVMASPALVVLQAERCDERGRVLEPARYSTQEMVGIERDMAISADRMASGRSFGVSQRHVAAALARQDEAINRAARSVGIGTEKGSGVGGNAADGLRGGGAGGDAVAHAIGNGNGIAGGVSVGGGMDAGGNVGSNKASPGGVGKIGLSTEQRAAIKHVTGTSRIAAVVGLAGAGKSTMLAAAREAWEEQGYRVHGAALAGKAAEGLEESAGIASRTLASWERGWERGFDRLGPKDVFVIDEAGMVGSKQLSRFIQEADLAGAKIVLVGDPEQLQPIGPGAAFRAVAERVGFVELEEIRRQRAGWQREASVDFGRHRTTEGLAAYAEHGAISFAETGKQAREEIVRDVIADMQERPEGSRLVLAHRNIDVQALNEAIRSVRKERGELVGEQIYQTSEGERAFAAGDRVLFRENNRDLGVKNGMLGTVVGVTGLSGAEGIEGRDGLEGDGEQRLVVRLDSSEGPGRGRVVSVSMADYAAVDHGYAATIHKSQGATVDRAYVLASGTMDRHLTYVAMTRHRDGVQIYADRSEFSDVSALAARLSRSQAKETTLDYERRSGSVQAAQGLEQGKAEAQGQGAQKFAERRGLDVRSEIVVPQTMWEHVAQEHAVSSGAVSGAEPAVQRSERKRGMFDGLKLGTGHVVPPGRERDGVRASGFDGLRLPAGERVSEPMQLLEASDLAQAVDRYALAWTNAQKMKEQDLPVLEHQKLALRDARAAMDKARPRSSQDLINALTYEPTTYQAMTQMQGRERVIKLIAGIEHEARVWQEPGLKVERLVKVWNGLEAKRNGLRGPDHAEAREKVEAAMKVITDDIKRDPQLESLLRSRQRELGIVSGSSLDRVVNKRDTGRVMGRGMRRGLDHGMDFGM